MNSSPYRSAAWMTCLLLAVHVTLGNAMFWVLFSSIPRHAKEYKEFGLALPAMTTIVLNISSWVNQGWFVLYPAMVLFFIADAAIVFTCWLKSRTRILSILWSVLVTVLLLLIGLGIIHFGIWLPRAKLLEGLSQ